MPLDYFPLKEKTRYEYEFKSSEFDGIAKVYIDILKVSVKGKTTSADARMIFNLRDEHISMFKIKKDGKWVITTDGIVVGGRKEFPLKPKEGFKWDEYPDSNEIVSMTDKLLIKAGKFSNCLKVLTKIAGGDAGMATRYYAPGVGYVMEVYNAEDKNCFVELVSVSKLKEEDIDIKKRKKR
ncbi:MAG: hypothetical protein K6357_03890 [Elusimicrobiota bacterium]